MVAAVKPMAVKPWEHFTVLLGSGVASMFKKWVSTFCVVGLQVKDDGG